MRRANKQLWTTKEWERFHDLQFKADFYEGELEWMRKQREKQDRIIEANRRKRGWATGGSYGEE